MDRSVVVHDQWQDPFFRIPNDVIDNQELNPYELSVLVVLRRYANNNPNHQAWPSTKTISQNINCSETTVKKTINTLIEKHYLLKENRFGDDGSKTSNVYTLINPYPHGRQTPMGESRDAYTHGRETTIKKNYIYKELNKKDKSSSSKDQFYKDIEKYKEVSEFYQKNIGFLAPSNVEVLDDLVNRTSSDLVIAALKVALKENNKKVSYVEGIINNWLDANVTTLDDAREFQRKWQEKKGLNAGGKARTNISDIRRYHGRSPAKSYEESLAESRAAQAVWN